MYLPHIHMFPDSPCTWRRFDMGLIDTHRPSPHSSCPCILAGSNTCGNYLHLHTAQHFYTHSPSPHLREFEKEEAYGEDCEPAVYYQHLFRFHSLVHVILCLTLLENSILMFCFFNRQQVIMKWFLTLFCSIVLAGHARDVTVKSLPSILTVAGPGGCCLRTRASVLTVHLATQVCKGLQANEEKRKTSIANATTDVKGIEGKAPHPITFCNETFLIGYCTSNLQMQPIEVYKQGCSQKKALPAHQPPCINV